MISRSTLLGALAVAELAILGLAAQAVSGPGVSGWPSFHGVRHIAFAAPGSLAGAVTRHLDKTFATRRAPHVTIDVDRADVTVTAGAPGVVHVTGTMSTWGSMRGVAPSLDAFMTADGVRVAVESGLVYGRIRRAVQLTVPPDASVQIASAGDVSVNGLSGALDARTGDGDVRIANYRGNVDVTTRAGNAELVDVTAGALSLRTGSGDVKLTSSGADRVEVETSSGDITADGLRIIDGSVRSSSGDVHVGFAPSSNAAVSVRSDSGTITGADDGVGAHALRLGVARGTFTITTASGDITVRQGANV